MRAWLFAVLLFSLASPLHDLPPFGAVEQNNSQIVPMLNNFLEENVSVQGNLTFNTSGFDRLGKPTGFRGSLPMLEASARVVMLWPSVDGRLVSAEDARIYIAFGAAAPGLPRVNPDPYDSTLVYPYCISSRFEGVPSIPPEDILSCDYEYNWYYNRADNPSEGDDSRDDCPEYMSSRSAYLAGNVTYAFRNETFSQNITNTTMLLPEGLRSALADASGAEQLGVILDARMVFDYTIKDGHSTPCVYREVNVTSEIQIRNASNYTAEGEHMLFFLHRPVLREQWHMNNRFDVLVLSQKRLARAEVLLNRKVIETVDLFDFDVSEDHYGMRHISSVNDTNGTTASSAAQRAINAAPAQLQAENRSYGYAYMFNATYQGIGENNLTLRVYDLRNRSTTYSEVITSRMLSHSNSTTEAGTSADPATSRSSAAFGKDTAAATVVGLGAMSLLVLLMLFNRVMLK